MRYIMILISVLVFIGCGGNSTDENPPASPQSKDSKNIPPSIPKI